MPGIEGGGRPQNYSLKVATLLIYPFPALAYSYCLGAMVLGAMVIGAMVLGAMVLGAMVAGR